MTVEVPLVLGGHSFIKELGSDPAADPGEQDAIVSACLDCGIRTFDTTYQPERVAVGRILRRLGRRKEAKVIAWNFFCPEEGKAVERGAEYYRPEHIGRMMDELGTDRIDHLVVHGLDDSVKNREQEELAESWKREGKVGSLGTWWPSVDTPAGPYDFMVRPWNLTQGGESGVFEACRRKGWLNFGCSPFVRGWKLDELAARFAAREGLPVEEARARLADLMFRFAAFQPFIDRLIVAMRRVEWVRSNMDSYRRGPLTAEEAERLSALQ